MNGTVAYDRAKFDRLRYLAEHFQSLQGLTSIALGGSLVLTDIGHMDGFPWWFRLLSSALGLLLIFAAVRYVPKYYKQRFGSVESRVRRLSRKEAILKLVEIILILVFVVMALIWPVISRYANPVVAELSNVAHRKLSDPEHRANLLAVLFSFMFLWFWGSNRSPFGRLRGLSFAVFLLLVWTGALVYLPIRYPEVSQQTLWRILNANWMGITLIFLGLFQHLTLVQLLPGRGLVNS